MIEEDLLLESNPNQFLVYQQSKLGKLISSVVVKCVMFVSSVLRVSTSFLLYTKVI